jgi:ketosteroid isomerase-like protein
VVSTRRCDAGEPLGPPVKGFDRVCQAMDSAGALISEGEGYTFDPNTLVETADLAYEVGIERNWAKLGDATEKVPLSLRVTTVFRREDDRWKIVHRHADPITAARPIQYGRSNQSHRNDGKPRSPVALRRRVPRATPSGPRT